MLSLSEAPGTKHLREKKPRQLHESSFSYRQSVEEGVLRGGLCVG